MLRNLTFNYPLCTIFLRGLHVSQYGMVFSFLATSSGLLNLIKYIRFETLLSYYYYYYYYYYYDDDDGGHIKL